MILVGGDVTVEHEPPGEVRRLVEDETEFSFTVMSATFRSNVMPFSRRETVSPGSMALKTIVRCGCA